MKLCDLAGTQFRSKPDRFAALIAAAFFLLATTYSIITPIFESPDELWHYPFVWHVARTGQLPVQDPTQPQLWAHEGSQAPLYYILAGLLTAPIPADDLPSLLYRNPHADIGVVSPDGNVNIVVHTARERWPWQGAVLAIHVARLFSALLGTGTVLAVYALGRVLWPERKSFALLAMVFVAFNPMFIFIAGSVNNDNMITLIASLTLWQLISLLVSEPDEPPLWRFAVLGILAGLAAISKLSGLAMVGLVGLSLLWWGLRRRSWRIALLGNGLVGVLTIAIAGWWYWRNISLYGDWSGTQNILAIMAPRTFTPTLAQWLVEAAGLLRSFWGVFGYFSVLMPAPVYWLLNGLLLIGVAGLLAALLPGQSKKISPRLRRVWPVLLLWMILMFIGLIRYTLLIPSSQGRLLFPAMAAFAIFWATGWTILIPPRWHILPALALVPLAIWVPWGVIAPAYRRPPPIAALPSSTRPLEVTFGDTATLLGYKLNLSVIQPGQALPITLYWRGERPTETDYSIFIHLVDENDLIVAQRDLFHGPGIYPTSQWTPNEQFGDTYVLQLPGTTFAPAQARFTVGLYDQRSGARLPASSGGDSVNFGAIKIQARPGQFPNPQQLRFEDGITLIGYSLDQRQVTSSNDPTLTLYWQGQDTPSQDYRVFVHLVGDNGLRVAQHDGEPQGGAAPTSSWLPDQTIIDEHPLSIIPDAPAGAYRLIVGLYESDTGQRLQLRRDGEVVMQADSVTLSGIRIVPP